MFEPPHVHVIIDEHKITYQRLSPARLIARSTAPKQEASYSMVSIADVTEMLNHAVQAPKHLPITVIVGTAMTIVACFSMPLLAALLLVGTAIAALLTANYDFAQRTVTLSYAETPWYTRRRQFTEQVIRAAHVSNHTWLERNANAALPDYTIITPTHLSRLAFIPESRNIPHVVQTGFTPAYVANAFALYFLPDVILIWTDRSYSAVTYEALTVIDGQVQFRLLTPPPTDGQILDESWLHTRVVGGPDLRYSFNPRIPRIRYGTLTLQHTDIGRLDFYASTISGRNALRDAVRALSERPHSDSKRDQQQTSPPPDDNPHQTNQKDRQEQKSKQRFSQPTSATLLTPYEVLGVAPTATPDEIASAYRSLAQKYHPDKVIHLGKEFQELADLKMKAINASYEQLTARR